MKRRSQRLLAKTDDSKLLEEDEKPQTNICVEVIDESKEHNNTCIDACETAHNKNDVEEESSSDIDDSNFDVEEFTMKFADKLISELKLKKKENISGQVFGFSDGIRKKKDSEEETPKSIDCGELNIKSCLNFETPSSHNQNEPSVLDKVIDVDTLMRKHSVIGSDFEAKHSAPVPHSVRYNKKLRKKERDATTGKDWFNMKAPELTEDLKRDLEVLKMRSIINPKRFYKSNDRKSIPKYFQVGKVMDNAADFYSSRIPKKQRKQTLTDELLADAEFKKYQKRKMSEIVAKQRALGGGRKLLKKKKFSKKS